MLHGDSRGYVSVTLCDRFAHWLPLTITGIVFMAAAIGKSWFPEETAKTLQLVGIPLWASQVGVRIVAAVELAMGLAMVLGWRSRVLIGTAVALLVAFTMVLIRLAMVDSSHSCSCLGPILDQWSGHSVYFGIGRNAVLIALLTLAWFQLTRRVAGGPPCSQSRDGTSSPLPA